jgi:hypothetical protein
MILIRGYVLALIIGIVVGIKQNNPSHFLTIETRIGTLFWPIAGILSGMIFSGVGPFLAILILGNNNGILIGRYIAGGDYFILKEANVDPSAAYALVEVCRSLIESISFLYASVGGLYLYLYYRDIFDTGYINDETPKKNSVRKILESIILAAIAAGLKSVTF